MNIEVRHARVVVALAETRSISKAATRLTLPQPSLSAQLRRIEKAVGGPLFVRSRLGIEPTGLGERFIPMMAELAAHADAITARIGTAAGGDALRVGNVEWTPVALQKSIFDALSGVEVRTETLDSPATALAAVRRGQLDAALVSNVSLDLLSQDDGPDLAASKVVSEPVWVALPRGGGDRTGLGLAGLRSLKWVLRARGHSFSGVEERFFHSVLGGEPEAVHRVAGHAEAMSWVHDARVAALATVTAATRDVDLVDPAVDVPHSDLTLVWRRGALDRPSLCRLVRALRAYYCEYARAFPRYWSWLTANPGAVPELAGLLVGADRPAPLPVPHG